MSPKVLPRRGLAGLLALLATAAPVAAPAHLNVADAGRGGTPAAPALAARIDSILARPSLRGVEWGIEVREVRTGRPVYAREPHRPRVPASNLKLVVSAAAAHHLPPDFRYRTTVHAAGRLAGGTLQGDVVLVGRGDPTLSARYFARREAVLDSLAALLRERGVRRVTGGVVADESAWDAEPLRADWEAYDTRWWYAAPVGALGFNDNAVDFRVRPGAAPGDPPILTWAPAAAGIRLRNDARTGRRGSASTFDLERDGPDGVRAYGSLPAGAAPRTEHFAVDDAARFTGRAFAAALRRAGIALGADTVRVVRAGQPSPAAGTAPLAEHRSPPLAQVIGPILQNSQNWFAEQLLKTLGREVRGQGSWEAGLAVEREFLVGQVGMDGADFVLRDGSGLSAGNRMTPRALVQLLRYVRRTPGQAAVYAALPAGGGEGSLRARLGDLGPRVRAKTGYIGGVDSLSGYLVLADGRELAFSIIANGTVRPAGPVKAGIDDVVRALAWYAP